MATKSMTTNGSLDMRSVPATSPLASVVSALVAVREGMRARDAYMTMVGQGAEPAEAAAKAMARVGH